MELWGFPESRAMGLDSDTILGERGRLEFAHNSQRTRAPLGYKPYDPSAQFRYELARAHGA